MYNGRREACWVCTKSTMVGREVCPLWYPGIMVGREVCPLCTLLVYTRVYTILVYTVLPGTPSIHPAPWLSWHAHGAVRGVPVKTREAQKGETRGWESLSVL